MKCISVIGLQWGDEGKGKVVDYLSENFDAVVRFNGGSNAGHTVLAEGKKFIFHLLPSGSLRAKKLLIGPGVAVDPEILKEELKILNEVNHDAILHIDPRSSIVSPLEKELDLLIERIRGTKAIGTTRRGIGPAYAMRALRLTPTTGQIASGYFDIHPMKSFYETLGLNYERLEGWMREYSSFLRPLIGNVPQEIYEMQERGESVIFEGSQGTMLDLLFGTYPYVTSSQTTAGFIHSSLGVNVKFDVLGVAKCYTTRVGSGPFPSEMSGLDSERIREAGNEYGSTTGRPRRIGWLDMVLLRYACKINNCKEVALMKLDVLAEIKQPFVCISYNVEGREVKEYDGSFPLETAKPNLLSITSFYKEDVRKMPKGVKEIINLIENETSSHVRMLSYGQKREDTIEL